MGQIGTIKIETQKETRSIPVYAIGDSGSGVYEYWRVNTPNGTGFVPLAAISDATYSEIRMNTPSGDLAVHDAASTSDTVQVTDSIVHHWKMDEGSGSTVADSQGSLSGSLNGSYSWTSSSKFNDYAIDFSGGYINLGSDTNSSSGVTFTCWVHLDSVNGSGVFSLDSSGASYYLFGTDSSSLTFGYRSNGNNPGASISASTGTWIHVACKYSGGTIYIYKNGSQVASDSSGDAQDQDRNYHEIGRQNQDRPMDGIIDDFRIYDTALSESQINDIYQNTK